MAGGLITKKPGLYAIKPLVDVGFYYEMVSLVEDYTGEPYTMSNVIDTDIDKREFIGPFEPQKWED